MFSFYCLCWQDLQILRQSLLLKLLAFRPLWCILQRPIMKIHQWLPSSKVYKFIYFQQTREEIINRLENCIWESKRSFSQTIFSFKITFPLVRLYSTVTLLKNQIFLKKLTNLLFQFLFSITVLKFYVFCRIWKRACIGIYFLNLLFSYSGFEKWKK